MPQLAQLNIAHLREPIDSPLLADFAAELDNVNAQAEAASGFVWRLKDDTGNATAISATSPWGPEWLVNLSTWQSTEALQSFVYRQQDHTKVLKQRTKWFHPMTTPHFCMWWLQDGEVPTLIDAKRRLTHLLENGETPYSFTFKKQFAAEQSIAPESRTKYLLRLADDALIQSHRISEWCGHGPILEEDLALGNIALDYLGQARLLYAYIGRIEGRSRSEDDFAYFRNDNEFFNSSLVELPNSSAFGERDYAVVISKIFLHSALMLDKWRLLQQSTDTELAAIAAKSLKETRYHFDHAKQWVLRFGDGTEESHQRMKAALNYHWGYCNEWFVDDAVDLAAIQTGLGTSNAALKPAWLQRIKPVVLEATLTVPSDVEFISKGKQGYHSESLSYLLAEMQSLARQHPGAVW